MSTPNPALVERLAALVDHWRGNRDGLFTLGICGAQGSGKSTLVAALAERLRGAGLRVAVLSLDDLYLTRAERQQLARAVHPLFATRGVPGTHDVALGLATLAALGRGEAAPLPRFDKGTDDRTAPSEWPRAPENTQVALFEGWCVGALPQPPGALSAPVNALEAAEDPDGRWRRHVNAALARDYAPLWDAIDRLVLIAAPGWHAVAGWREEQEAKLRSHAAGAMTTDAVARFIRHYERLTRWILTEMPARADLTVQIDEARNVL